MLTTLTVIARVIQRLVGYLSQVWEREKGGTFAYLIITRNELNGTRPGRILHALCNLHYVNKYLQLRRKQRTYRCFMIHAQFVATVGHIVCTVVFEATLQLPI